MRLALGACICMISDSRYVTFLNYYVVHQKPVYGALHIQPLIDRMHIMLQSHFSVIAVEPHLFHLWWFRVLLSLSRQLRLKFYVLNRAAKFLGSPHFAILVANNLHSVAVDSVFLDVSLISSKWVADTLLLPFSLYLCCLVGIGSAAFAPGDSDTFSWSETQTCSGRSLDYACNDNSIIYALMVYESR